MKGQATPHNKTTVRLHLLFGLTIDFGRLKQKKNKQFFFLF